MSRSGHARKPRVNGHRARIRAVTLFDRRRGYQAVCSCAEVGLVNSTHASAEAEKAAHLLGVVQP
jgi:hypothetical protein